MIDPILEASGLHRQLGFVLRQAYGAVWQDLIDTLKPFGLTPQTYGTLLLVEATPGCKQQDIADALEIQRPNMVSLIDRLVEAGWLLRATNTADRRSYALALTDAGRNILSASREAHRFHEARIVAVLDPEAADAIIVACERLTKLTSDQS